MAGLPECGNMQSLHRTNSQMTVLSIAAPSRTAGREGVRRFRDGGTAKIYLTEKRIGLKRTQKSQRIEKEKFTISVRC
jgi:hypothetical protein